MTLQKTSDAQKYRHLFLNRVRLDDLGTRRMKWLILIPILSLIGCHPVMQEVLEPKKVMVTPIHQQPTIPFLEDKSVDVTHTRVQTF